VLYLLLAISLSPALAQQAPEIVRDSFGVPHIHGRDYRDAFFQAGYAVAQDRLWQMELSRRLCRGRLAEVLGPGPAASDKEVLASSYTDAELQTQFDHMSSRARQALASYAEGVNAWIAAAGSHLPAGYAAAGFKPAPWTVLDSEAICIHMLQLFGRGGAGELRNMAALDYLQGQKPLAGHALDAMDDLEWFNDHAATPTLSTADDPQADSHYVFYQPDRKATEAHLAMLPKLGLFELLPAIQVGSREESTRVAEALSVPFRTGSYCVAVGPSRSADHHAMLLGGPQMGLRVPSIVHEMSIEAPGLSTVGMDIPGVPGIIIGRTKSFAWSITSGVADTEDVFFYRLDGSKYRVGSRWVGLEGHSFPLKVKGQPDSTVDQMRTVDGFVMLRSPSTQSVFARKSAYWMREMQSFDSWTRLWTCDSAPSIEKSVDGMTMNFNFFYATQTGDIGWKYAGLIPRRAPGIDPRFPTPGSDPRFGWRGFLSSSELPHVRNPKSGLLANWNNKPVDWWPNSDTPVWGRIFENSSLLSAVSSPSLTLADLSDVPSKIAVMDETWPYFKPYVLAAGRSVLSDWDGRLLDGSKPAAVYGSFVNVLRRELFLSKTGGFLNADLFRLILQPSVMLRALEGKTSFDFLAGRTASDLVRKALDEAVSQTAAPYRAGSFRSLDPQPILYDNRGTYIQVIDFKPRGLLGMNVLTPGVAESGPHANDQASLARSWAYKPMGF